MYGITAYLLRCLCETGFGGYGCTPKDLARLTPDQIWFLACDKEMLKKKPFSGRTKDLPVFQASPLMDKDGYARGRDADGNPISKPLSLGKSVAQLIREKQAVEKEAAEKSRKRKGRRNGT